MEVFIGVDVGKFALDICISPLDKCFRVDNTKVGLCSLLEKIKKCLEESYSLKLIVCEATGGYEASLVEMLKENNLPVHVAHPNKVRSFGKALGKLAKTDKIDAKILSEYATVFNPKPDSQGLGAELKLLKAYQQRRRQLLDELTRETNRLDRRVPDPLNDSITKHVKWLKQEVEEIEEMIENCVKSHQFIKEEIDLITSIPGVGIITASAILTDLPEIYELESKSISSLVGVAPMNKDSGTKTGKKRIYGGRAPMRKALYMATVASIKWNPFIKEFYLKLRSKGKPAKVAIVAAMHKLLLIIKSVLNRRSNWVTTLSRA